MASKYELVIEQEGKVLAQNLAYYCIAAVKEVIDTLAPHGAVPKGVDLTGASLVVLSIRAAIDLHAVSEKFGDRASDLMLEILDKHFSAGGLVTVPGGFKVWVAAAHKTMAANPDPRDWVRAQCVAMLDTQDPQDELFHSALAAGVTAGTPLWSEIEAAANRRN